MSVRLFSSDEDQHKFVLPHPFPLLDSEPGSALMILMFVIFCTQVEPLADSELSRQQVFSNAKARFMAQNEHLANGTDTTVALGAQN